MISITDLEKTYRIGDNEYPVLKGISLDIEEGEFIALMGPSGSGKSTLMNIVGCLDRPTKGRFILLGKDISQTSDDELAKIRREVLGFIFQTFNLIGRISVLKNVEMPMVLAEVPREERRSRAIELLESVGLGHRLDFSPLRISGGERQRVAIARALANDPKIIIADEPTGNLDPEVSHGILKIFQQINNSGTAVLMATHSYGLIKKFPARVLKCEDGKVMDSSLQPFELTSEY